MHDIHKEYDCTYQMVELSGGGECGITETLEPTFLRFFQYEAINKSFSHEIDMYYYSFD